MVAMAGPVMNLLLAAIVSLLVIVGGRSGILTGGSGLSLIDHVVLLNLSLMFFNLLPIPPLDGGAVLAWVLPHSFRPFIALLEKWGPLVLLIMVMIPALLGVLMYPAFVVMSYWRAGVMGSAGF